MKMTDCADLTGEEESEMFQAKIAHQHRFEGVEIDVHGQW